MTEVLIVEDDPTFAVMLSTWLKKKGMHVNSAASLSDARQKLSSLSSLSFILSDVYLPDGTGIDLLKWLKEKGGAPPIILMTNRAQIPIAVQAIKLGASDYISKPVNQEELWVKITELLRIANVQQSSEPAHVNIPDVAPIEGNSPVSRQMYDHVRLVAPTDMSVLITGASGTGKEYIARRIHELSERCNKPFIAVDCGAIPRELAASEFFGHIKGSFTGAIDNKTGAFEAAHGGTIFLDEIGNLAYEIQVHLLRVLQERAVKPIGSNRLIQTNVRLISATNENLRSAIASGHFREDLYHRINEFTIRVPDLSERQEDIPLFARRFLEQSNAELQKQIKDFDSETAHIFLYHPWPGNLRQMKNVVKYATLLASGDHITPDDLPEEMKNVQPAPHLKDEMHERNLIAKALLDNGNNKTLTARQLGIDRKTLYNKMKAYGMDI
jgi:two-component system response regulator HydG